MKTLPRKPSALLKTALEDLEVIENTRGYKVKMHIWHTPIGDECSVCLAGSVMARRLNINKREDAIPSDFLSAKTGAAEVADRLYAIDAFRKGLVGIGLLDLGYSARVIERIEAKLLGPAPPCYGYCSLPITSYDQNPRQFKLDMETLIGFLESEGL